MSSAEAPEAVAAARRAAIAALTRSSRPEDARAGAGAATDEVVDAAAVFFTVTRSELSLVTGLDGAAGAVKATRLGRPGCPFVRAPEPRTVLAAGTGRDLGVGRGRWARIDPLTSTELSAGRGAISSSDWSLSNGVRRRLARSPEARAAPVARASAPAARAGRRVVPDPSRGGTGLGSAISRSSVSLSRR